MSFNKVVLLGNLTSDPESRTTPSGSNVTSFSIAVNRRWRGRDGGQQEETSYIDCTAWGAQGDNIAKYLSKGRQVLICGRLRQDRWQDKETGKNRSSLGVVVEEFSFVNDGRGGGNATTNGSSDNSYNFNGYSGNATNSQAGPSDKGAIAADDLDNPIELSDIPF